MAFTQDASNSGAGETLGLSMPTLSTIMLTRNPTATSRKYPVLMVGMQQWSLIAQQQGDYTFVYPTIFTEKPFIGLRCYLGNIEWTANQFDLSFKNLSETQCLLRFNTVGGTRSAMIMLIGKQQWGDIVNGTNTFIVPFVHFCRMATTGSYSWGGYDNIIRSIELTNFTATYDDATYLFLYIVIGKQQWGSNQQTVSAETLVAYPVAVNTVLTILCTADQTDIHDAEYAGPGSITDANFIACTFALFGSVHALPQPYFWLMFGIAQQWGYFYESQSDTDYRHFPVAFTTFLLPVLGKAYYLTTEPDGYVPYIEYLGSNNFLCGFGNNRIGNAYVPIMVIGMQQWGKYVELASAFLTVNFPISFKERILFANHVNNKINDNGYAPRPQVTDSLSSMGCAVDSWANTANPNCIHYWYVVGI